jgi:hypothetical protein
LWNISDYFRSCGDLSKLPEIIGSIREHREIQTVVLSKSKDGVMPALWLQVLLSLTVITTDVRTEVRNSAIHTIQRIFESYDGQLSSEIWLLCMRVVLFRLVEANKNAQQDLRNAPHGPGDLINWNATTRTVLQTVSILMTTYAQKVDPSELGDAWSELLIYMQQYFCFGSHALGASIFNTITSFLSHIRGTVTLDMPPLLETANVWKAYFDHQEKWQTEPEGNQDAFVAYADAFAAIYCLGTRALDAQLPSMLAKLEACVVNSDVAAYSSDIDKVTALQGRVMHCLSMVTTDSPGLPSYLILLLGRFSVLPHTTPVDGPAKRGPTFVALAKAAMTLLQETIMKHIDREEIFENDAVLSALTSLMIPIREKYLWQREGKPPALWQRATTTTVTILKPILPRIDAKANTKMSLKETWAAIVDIAHYIIRAQLPSVEDLPTSLGKDEAFDVESFKEFRDTITVSLGATNIPDVLRRTYARNLFSISLIHTPLPGELPELISAPLEGLYKIRYGHTVELETTLRSSMSYTCLSELFSLVALHDNSASRTKLAQAAAPYLILRAALPLRTFIADHPLRGCMPQPESQRHELLFILRELARLKSEPQAIPDVLGVKSKHRKHLHRLYPLLSKASRVARHDVELFEGIVKLMDMVGEEFGLDDE